MGRRPKERVYRKWSMEEKRSAVARMDSITHYLLAAELGIEKRILYKWRDDLRLEKRFSPLRRQTRRLRSK